MSMWKPWSKAPKPEEGKKLLVWWANYKPQAGIDFLLAEGDEGGWYWVTDATQFVIHEDDAPDYWTDDIPPECL